MGWVVLGVALLLLTVFVALRFARRGREMDARVVAAVGACFAELGRLRGLELMPATPYHHPIIGEVSQAPRLKGVVRGVRISLALEGEPSGDEALEMTLRIAPPAGAVWPSLRRPCRDAAELPPAAQRAVSALCERSRRVEIGPEGLVAVPSAEQPTGWTGREHRCEVEPARLDAWLGLALEVALALGIHGRS